MVLIWSLLLAALLVIPAIMIFCGYIRQNIRNNVGAKFGYNSDLALSSPEAWAYAQKASIKRYIIAGAVIGVLAIALMIPTTGANTISLIAYSTTLFLFELLIWCFIIVSVESGLRKLLGVTDS